MLWSLLYFEMLQYTLLLGSLVILPSLTVAQTSLDDADIGNLASLFSMGLASATVGELLTDSISAATNIDATATSVVPNLSPSSAVASALDSPVTTPAVGNSAMETSINMPNAIVPQECHECDVAITSHCSTVTENETVYVTSTAPVPECTECIEPPPSPECTECVEPTPSPECTECVEPTAAPECTECMEPTEPVIPECTECEIHTSPCSTLTEWETLAVTTTLQVPSVDVTTSVYASETVPCTICEEPTQPPVPSMLIVNTTSIETPSFTPPVVASVPPPPPPPLLPPVLPTIVNSSMSCAECTPATVTYTTRLGTPLFVYPSISEVMETPVAPTPVESSPLQPATGEALVSQSHTPRVGTPLFFYTSSSEVVETPQVTPRVGTPLCFYPSSNEVVETPIPTASHTPRVGTPLYVLPSSLETSPEESQALPSPSTKIGTPLYIFPSGIITSIPTGLIVDTPLSSKEPLTSGAAVTHYVTYSITKSNPGTVLQPLPPVPSQGSPSIVVSQVSLPQDITNPIQQGAASHLTIGLAAVVSLVAFLF